MRVIPPNYYSGKIPDGYEKKQFFRFDSKDGETYGVLYSGERINVNQAQAVQSLAQRVWKNIRLFFK